MRHGIPWHAWFCPWWNQRVAKKGYGYMLFFLTKVHQSTFRSYGLPFVFHHCILFLPEDVFEVKAEKRPRDRKEIFKQWRKNTGSVSVFFVYRIFQMKFHLFLISNIIHLRFFTPLGWLCTRPKTQWWIIMYISHHLNISMSKYMCSFIYYLNLPIVKLIVSKWLCKIILDFEMAV